MTKLSVKLWKDKAFLNGEFQELRRIAVTLPGFKKFVNDSLMFEPSGRNIEHLLQFSIDWQEAKHLEDNCRQRLEKEATARQMLSETEFSIENFKFKTKPFDHQKKAFMLSKDAPYYGYFMEMGTGKTKVIIDGAAYLYLKNEIQCLIILAPNGVHSQWVNEQIPTHLPDWVQYDSLTYRASEKSSIKKIDEFCSSSDSNLKIVSFNIESLSNKKGITNIEKLLKAMPCMLVIDESTRIKTPGSLRTKAAMKMAQLAKFRRIMSGAPVTKGYEDLYSQLKFLHPDVLGFNSFYTFRNYYCIMGGFEGRQIVGYRPNAEKDLEDRICAYTFRVTKNECLDLPEKIYTTRIVELTDEQEKLYEAIEDEFALDMRTITNMKSWQEGGDAQQVDSALMAAITKMLRMQQIICGHMVIGEEDSRQIIDIPSKRIDVLMDCIEEAQGKVIVWCRFIHDLKKISQRLNKDGIMHCTYHGEVSGRDREAAIDRFKNHPGCKVFLAQPASGGTGLNLAVADTVIYFSNDFNADTRWQSEDRAHRIGQKSNVTYIDLISLRTIDEEIVDSLRSKKNLADALLDNPQRFARTKHA